MNLAAYSTTCLFVCLLVMQGYSHLRHHFSGVDELKVEISQLRKRVVEEQLKTVLAREQSEDLRENVAALLSPKMLNDVLDHSQNYQLRSIASVTQDPKVENVRKPKELLTRGKEAFRKNEYNEAVEVLRELINVYPYSPSAPEGLFLLIESQFQLAQALNVVRSVEIMMNQYPENELTGFAMLRLSDIYIMEDRREDAKEILETAQKNYKNPDLQKQIELSLKRL